MVLPTEKWSEPGATGSNTMRDLRPGELKSDHILLAYPGREHCNLVLLNSRDFQANGSVGSGARNSLSRTKLNPMMQYKIITTSESPQL